MISSELCHIYDDVLDGCRGSIQTKWLVSFCTWTTAIIYVNALRNRIRVKTMNESTHQLNGNCQPQLQEPSKITMQQSQPCNIDRNGIAKASERENAAKMCERRFKIQAGVFLVSFAFKNSALERLWRNQAKRKTYHEQLFISNWVPINDIMRYNCLRLCRSNAFRISNVRFSTCHMLRSQPCWHFNTCHS